MSKHKANKYPELSNYAEMVVELEPLMNWMFTKNPPLTLERQDYLQEARWILYRSLQEYDASKNAKFTTYYARALQYFLYDTIRKANRKKSIPLNCILTRDLLPEEYTDGILKSVDKVEPNPEEIYFLREDINDWLQDLSVFEKETLLYYLETDKKSAEWSQIIKEDKRYQYAYQRCRKKIKNALNN